MENNNSNSYNEKQGPNLNPTDLLSLSNYHSLWNQRSNPSSSPAAAREMEEEEEEEEEKPSHLNTLNSSGLFQHVSTDKMSVEYVGTQQHGYDVGAAQADCPAPTRSIAYYFEMKVTNAGDKGQVSIGFTCRDYNLRRQPGWESNSCGYHGDDGFIYRGHGKGEAFGPTYTTGDTVGAGINYASQEFFFTKNGKLVGTVDKDIKGPLYPTVAVHGQNEKVTVNFGQQHFLFDIKTYRSEEILKQRKVFEKLPLPPNVSHWIVRSYLLHYGYQDTLSSFDAESENSSLRNPTAQENGISEQEDAYALNHRKNLRQLIRKGNIDSAFHYLRNWYPQVVQMETSAICFLLHAQRFIEHIRGFIDKCYKISCIGTHGDRPESISVEHFLFQVKSPREESGPPTSRQLLMFSDDNGHRKPEIC